MANKPQDSIILVWLEQYHRQNPVDDIETEEQMEAEHFKDSDNAPKKGKRL